MTKKLILLLATCLLCTSCLFGCGDDNTSTSITNDTNDTNDTNVTVSETEPTTTEAIVETTTKAPEPTTEYVYKGKKFAIADKSLESYFSGLILENGGVIYLNDLYSDDSLDGNTSRGSIAYALLTALNMKDERASVKEKYWPDGAYSPEIPYGDNYSIKYDGQKVQFVLVEKAVDGIFFDVVPVE